MMDEHNPPGTGDRVPDFTTVGMNDAGGTGNQIVPPGTSEGLSARANASTHQQVQLGTPYYTMDASGEDPFALGPGGIAGQHGMGAPPIQLTNAHQSAAFASNHPQWSAPMAPAAVPIPQSQCRWGGKHAHVLKVILVCLLLAVGVGFLSMTLFASATTVQPTPTSTPQSHQAQKTPVPSRPPSGHPTPPPVHMANQPAGDWVPAHLPAGWAAAGLNKGDELFAWRTAMTFNDREMSIDSRNVGTAGNHGGTLTAAVFV